MLPAISVVIPAFNEAVRIGDTLATTIAYLEKESPGSELIVINDGSTDSTGEVIRKVAAVPSAVAIRLLENFPNRGKGAAVRSGLLSATKPIAVFFDADRSRRSGYRLWFTRAQSQTNRKPAAMATRTRWARF